MLPDANPTTGYLPPGVHDATWGEVMERFTENSWRLRLAEGLLAACKELAGAGCRSVLLNGSFVSLKAFPGDYDGAWDPSGVDPDLLDPVLLDFSDGRAAMKAKYYGELFPETALASAGTTFRDFFRTDRDGREKGVVLIELGSLP